MAMRTKDTREATLYWECSIKDTSLLHSSSLCEVKLTHYDCISQVGLVCYICTRYKRELSYSSHCDLDIKYHTQQYRKTGQKLLGKKVFFSAAE